MVVQSEKTPTTVLGALSFTGGTLGFIAAFPIIISFSRSVYHALADHSAGDTSPHHPLESGGALGDVFLAGAAMMIFGLICYGIAIAITHLLLTVLAERYPAFKRFLERVLFYNSP